MLEWFLNLPRLNNHGNNPAQSQILSQTASWRWDTPTNSKRKTWQWHHENTQWTQSAVLHQNVRQSWDTMANNFAKATSDTNYPIFPYNTQTSRGNKNALENANKILSSYPNKGDILCMQYVSKNEITWTRSWTITWMRGRNGTMGSICSRSHRAMDCEDQRYSNLRSFCT